MRKFSIIILLLALFSCEDERKKPVVDFANDVTFNYEENSIDVEIPDFNYVLFDEPFKARAYRYGEITFNAKKNADGTHTGFALSNKNWRSYPWSLSKPHGSSALSEEQIKSAVDSCIFSVASGTSPNQLKNFAVVRVEGDDAFFTLDKPRIVEHVLVANTTFNYLTLNYGSHYSSYLNKETQIYEEFNSLGKPAYARNPFIPNPSPTMYGYYYLPDIYNFRDDASEYISLGGLRVLKAKNEGIVDSPQYVKLIAVGYNGNKEVGKSEYYLAILKGSVTEEPYDKWNVIQAFWAPWDLSSLGLVDKVVFRMESTDVNEKGEMQTPPYFCLDGIRLK